MSETQDWMKTLRHAIASVKAAHPLAKAAPAEKALDAALAVLEEQQGSINTMTKFLGEVSDTLIEAMEVIVVMQNEIDQLKGVQNGKG